MALKIYTAQYRYGGPDRYDITVKGGVAKAFSPSWDMVMGYKNGTVSEEEYVARYTLMMATSRLNHSKEWEELLAMDEVTLVCFCANGSFCHRHILADILVTMGAINMGPR